jgi:hypothetical protein
LADVLDGTLQNGTLVLVAVRHKTGNLVDPFIDCLTASALNWFSGSALMQ